MSSRRKYNTPVRNRSRGVEPVDLFNARGHLRGTAESNRRYMSLQIARMRQRSRRWRAQANARVKSVPERSVKTISTQIKCKDKDKEGANEYAHHESGQRVSKRLKYDVIEDIICPKWSEKVYHGVQQNIEFNANTEKLVEFVLMDRNFVLQRVRKAAGVSPLAHLMQNGFSGNASTTSVTHGMTQMVKFEGGKYTFTFLNTCSNTLHFEFRQYKVAGANLRVGSKISTKSPICLFQLDQANTYTFGDLPYGVDGNGAGPSTAQPENTNRLANWTITEVPEVAAAESNIGTQLYLPGYSHVAVLPSGKRPQRSSPLLHSNFDSLGILKIALKPGDSFVYDIRINPFTCDGVSGYNQPADHLIQYYSRVLHVYCRAEYNISAGNGDQMATGPGQYSFVSQHEMNWRAMPRFKRNNHFEQAVTQAPIGPNSELISPTAMEMQEPDTEAYNTAG